MAFSRSDLTPSCMTRWAGWAGFFSTTGEITDFGGDEAVDDSVLMGEVLPWKDISENSI